MTPHRSINLALFLAIAATAVLGPIVMDSPTELDTMQATAASVEDAQAAAVEAHHQQTAEVRP